MNIKKFIPGTRVLLQTDVKNGRVGDECTVISSRNGTIKVTLNGGQCILFVRKTQIKVIEKFAQKSLYSRWELDTEI